MFRKKCDNLCTIKYVGYHNICKVPPTRKRSKVNINSIIDEFHKFETVKYKNNFNFEIHLRRKNYRDGDGDMIENIFAVLFDIIKKFPLESILKVIDDVYGYRVFNYLLNGIIICDV